MILPKRWNLKPLDEELILEIARSLKISLPVAKVLVNRGVSSVREAELFMDPDKGVLHNPFLLPDMAAAVKRIRRAVDNGEKILVYGDRDVDGITSICIMVRTLKSLGSAPCWYIPSDEGYGVHKEVIDRHAAQGVTLIITVDCGISAAEGVKYAKSLGIDVVVTDHHEAAGDRHAGRRSGSGPEKDGFALPVHRHGGLRGIVQDLRGADAVVREIFRCGPGRARGQPGKIRGRL